MRLLRKNPYKITKNATTADGSISLRVQLNPECGQNIGSKVFQVLRPDGVIELIPENVFNAMNEKPPLQEKE
jgi:hypothetical protein